MAKVRVHAFSISLDGFGAGPNQALANPLGEGGEEFHKWVFETRRGREMSGQAGGSEGVDNDFIRASFENLGANLMGRNMFGPIRGEWGDDDWKGWWGDNPPYHTPVFVLTHYPHDPIPMAGGTTFYFIDESIEAAVKRSLEAADGKDVRIGGGVSVVQQALRAGLIDEMHVPVTPVLLGAGERLFVDGVADGYDVEYVSSPTVAHFVLKKK